MAYFGRKVKKPGQLPGAGGSVQEKGQSRAQLEGKARAAIAGRQGRQGRSVRSLRANRAERSAR